MQIVHLKQGEFKKEVIDSDKTVLVDFFATWCGPCQMLAPILDEIASGHDEFKIVKVDIDENRELSVEYDVMAVPTLIVFINGVAMRRHEGFATQEEILELVR